jgi:hypothetical protein
LFISHFSLKKTKALFAKESKVRHEENQAFKLEEERALNLVLRTSVR